MTETEGTRKLRDLAEQRRKLSADIDELTETLLREGEFVEAIAGALGVSRETVRRFRDSRDIPDPRATRKAKAAAARRSDGQQTAEK